MSFSALVGGLGEDEMVAREDEWEELDESELGELEEGSGDGRGASCGVSRGESSFVSCICLFWFNLCLISV